MLKTAKRGLEAAKLGLAARDVKKAKTPKEKDIARRALANLFANSKGILTKVGQLLAQSDDSPFRDLLDKLEPYPLSDILPILEKSLGTTVNDVFLEIDESQFAASLGQVHHAILKNGKEVAIKIQYPDVADAVDAELKLAGLMPGFGPVKKWGFDLNGYKKELKNNMDRELNYLSEAARQQMFEENLDISGLVIPHIYQELCTKQVLVQSWETGSDIDVASTWQSGHRQAIARVLLKTLFQSLFVMGEIHGDPHMGNYYYRITGASDAEVILLDYGCTVPITEHQRLALLKLIIALRENAAISPLQCFVAMGFDEEKLSRIDTKLPMLSRILFRPFLLNERFRVRDWQIQKDLDALLGEQRWWFRSAGPAPLFLLIRAFQGLSQNLEKIQGFADWWQLLEDVVGKETIDKARKFSLPALKNKQQGTQIVTLAKELRVQVFENDRQKVAVTLPAESVLDLINIMPEDIVAQLRDSNDINLEEIMQRIKDSGVAAQTVFDHTYKNKRYLVWLA